MPIYTVIGTATYFTNSGPTPPPAINYYLYTTGLNTYGQLGLGDTIDRSSPSLLSSGVSWLMFSNYGYSSSGIQSDSSLWTWGRNNTGQLGSGTTVDRSSPVKVGTDSWYRVRMGYGMAFGVKSDRTLWAWGENSDGYLGLNSRTTLYYSSPVQVGADLWEDVVPAGRITRQYVFAQRSGSALIYTWGNNFYGQLGLNDVIARSSPVQLPVVSLNQMPFVAVNGYSVLGQKTDSTLWAWGYNNTGQLGLGDTLNRSSPVQVGLDTWSSGATTFTNGFGVKSDGTLWGWGQNNVGQIGTPQVTTNTYTWSSVASASGPRGGGAPAYHVLRSDGTIWAWGYNNYGQLGVGDTRNRSSPTQVGSATNWTKLSQSSPGGFTGAINSLGQLFVWGDNRGGELGQLDLISRSNPVQIPGSWTQYAGNAGLKTGNTLWTWGIFNFDVINGLVGNGDGTTIRRSSPYQVGTSTYSYITSSGEYNTQGFYAIRSNGKLFAWGTNQWGTVGDGTTVNRTSMVAVLAVSSFSQVAAGGLMGAFGITTTGKLYAWGRDNYGNLGLTVRVNQLARSSPTQIGASSWTFIITGVATTMGVKLDSTLWAWGSDAGGEYGNDVRIAGLFRSSPVQVQSGTTWTTLGGFNYAGVGPSVTTVPILGIRGGELYQWGYGGGYLSPFNQSWGARSSPVQVPNPPIVVETYSYTSSPIQIGTDTQWGRVYGGTGGTIATDINGTLYAWGDNSVGELGTGDTVRRSSPVQIATGLAQTGLYVGYDARPGWSAMTYGKPTA